MQRYGRHASLAVFCCVVLITAPAGAHAVVWSRVATTNGLPTSGQLCTNDGNFIICDSTTPTISSGLVGIGSVGPITSLDLSQRTDAIALPVGTTGNRPTGANLTNGEIRYNSAAPAVEAYVNGAWEFLLGSSTGVLGTGNGGTGTGTTFTQGSVVFAGPSGVYSQDNAQFFWDDTNHRFGIGTATPSYDLSFGGAAARTIWMERGTTTGNNLTVQAGGGLSGGTNENGGNLVLASGITTGTGTSNVAFSLYPAGSSGTADNTALTALTVSATGLTGTTANTTMQANAGSGTNQNGGTLTLASGVSTGTGTSNISFNVYSPGSSGSTPNAATTAMTVASTGYVGIGTTSPAAALDVKGAIDLFGLNGMSYPFDLTTGCSIAIGGGALANMQIDAFGDSSCNTALGYLALNANTTALSNTAVGSYALTLNTGSYNTAIGGSTLSSNTSGRNNTAVGSYALAYSNGQGNTAVGASALEFTSTGIFNSAFGDYALYPNTTGNNNTASGNYALSSNTTGNNNTGLGYNVASTTLSTGSYNILIGVGSAGVAGGADTPAASTSNFLNIGNTLEGSTANASAVGAETLYLNSVASSVNYVQISGGATGTGPTIAAAGTDANVNLTLSPKGTGNTIIPTGDVGIGSTTPVASLDLSQKTDAIALPVGTTGTRPTGVNGMIRYNSATPTVEAYVNGAWESLGGGLTGSQYQVATFTGTNTASGNADILTDASNDFILTSGNLAIGTTTVTNAINLAGAAAQTIGMASGTTAGNNLTVQAGRGLSGGTNENGGNLVLASGITTGTGTANVAFSLYPAGSSGTGDNAGLTALTISATGLTGTTAATTLQANAGSGTNQNGGALTLASGVSTGTGTSSINFNVYGAAGSSSSTPNAATTAMTIASNGNVGIGSASPADSLDLSQKTDGVSLPVAAAAAGSSCTGFPTGTIRYNTTISSIEFCNGSVWTLLAAGSTSCSAPSGLAFTNVTGQSLGVIVTSNTATITFSGCTGSLSASVSGAATAQISINGGAWVTSGAITSGQTLQVRLTSSSSASTMLTATVTVGSSSTNWTVTTRSGSLMVFSTSNTYIGTQIGGLSGADAICQSEAGTLGYAGTYKAIMSDDTTSAASRLTLSYPIVRATDGTTVSTTNLWVGSLSNPVVPYVYRTANATWTGTNSDGSISTGNTCSSWSASGTNGLYGNNQSTSTSWVGPYPNTCSAAFYIYCIQQ